MKKLWILLTLLALCASPLCALAAPDTDAFDAAKEAVSLLSYREYGDAYTRLGISDADLSLDDFTSHAENDFRALYEGTVQKDVAVLFTKNDRWYLAIPVREPSDGRVETVVFKLNADGAFTGIACAKWEDVQADADASADTVWQDDYAPGDPVLVSDL